MKIAVIGAGNVGSALGRAWAKRGHDVVFGVRNPGEARFATLAEWPNIAVASNQEAAKEADVIALATP